MSYLFRLELRGLGTYEVESLLSYWCRLSETHGLTINQLQSQLAWWAEREGFSFPRSLLYGRVLSMCGFGNDVQRTVSLLERATSSERLERSTLLPLRPVLSKTGGGALRARRAWCPRCYQEDLCNHGASYDRLLWAIALVERCPIHRLRLESICPVCGADQRYPRPNGRLDLCHDCEKSLVGPSDRWVVRDAPSIAEREVASWFEYLARDGGLPVQENAFQTYERIARQIRRSRLAISDDASRSLNARICRPSLRTLLQTVIQDGANLVQVLTEPAQAANSASQLEGVGVTFDVITRTRVSSEVAARASAILSAYAVGDGTRSLAQVCNEIGVSKGYARHRFPKLSASVARLWNARYARIYNVKVRAATKALVTTEWDLYQSGKYSSQDEVAESISKHSNCSIRVARILVADRYLANHRNSSSELPDGIEQWLTSSRDLAALRNLSTTTMATKLGQQRRTGRIFDVCLSGKRYPKFQFDGAGMPREIIRELLNFVRPGAEIDLLLWFIRPHPLLSRQRPADVFETPMETRLPSLVEAVFS